MKLKLFEMNHQYILALFRRPIGTYNAVLKDTAGSNAQTEEGADFLDVPEYSVLIITDEEPEISGDE